MVVLAGFAAGLSTPRLARRVGDLAARAASWGKRLFRRKPVTWDGGAFVRFRARTNSLLRRRWHVLTLATLAGHLTVYLVLLVSLRVLGVTADEVTTSRRSLPGPSCACSARFPSHRVGSASSSSA